MEPNQEQKQFIRLDEVMRRTGLSKTRIYGLQDFPARISLGPKTTVWEAGEVVAWMAKRLAERNKDAEARGREGSRIRESRKQRESLPA